MHVNQLKNVSKLTVHHVLPQKYPKIWKKLWKKHKAEEIHDKPGYSHEISGKPPAPNIQPNETEQQMPGNEMPMQEEAEDDLRGVQQRYSLRKNPKKKIFNDFEE